MDPAAFENYLKERYQGQIDWYSAKASQNKSRYQIFQWGVIVLSAIVPVLVALDVKGNVDWVWWPTIIVSILLAIGTAGVKTFKFQENWINYRSTAERLIQEKFYYDGNVGDYGTTDTKQTLFVERVEKLLAGEGANWVTTQNSQAGQ